MPELPKHFAFIVSLSNEEPFTKRNTNSMELGLGLNLASATVKPKEDKADDELKHHKFLRPWTWATRPDDRPAGITVAIFKSDKDWIRKDRIDLTSTPPTNVWPDSDDWFGENDFSDAWTKLLSAFEERANSLSHLWDLGKPDIEAELNDSAEHLRDFHANLSTSAHPIGVYANVTRHAVQRIEFVEGMDHYLVFAAPKIDAKLFGNDKELTPDFAKVEELDPDNEDNQVVRIPYVDADKKNGQIDGVPVFAYMVPLRLLKSLPPPKPTAPEMEPSLVNLRNYWVRQRMEDEDLPWYADDWSSKLEVHAPLGFDLAQHLVDWLRLQLDKGPTATEDLNLLGVRDAVLCTLCDTSHPGDRASLAKVSLVDLLAFEMFQDDDRQRFKVAISEAYKELELQQWVDTLKAGVPTVKSMECLDEKEVLSLTL